MQTRLLVVLATLTLALAGCAENTNDPGDATDAATPPAAVSNADAGKLLAEAGDAGMPDKFGMKMAATKSGLEIMSAEGVFDEPAKTSYFRIKASEQLLQAQGGGGMEMAGFDAASLSSFAVYSSPQGNAFLMNGTLIVTEPQEEDEMGGGMGDSFEGLTDPEDFLEELTEQNVTVKSVTPTTLRGRGALKIDLSHVDEDDGAQNASVWLFQKPTRVARVEALADAPGDDEDDPFAGAIMTMDFLYEDEVTLTVPTDVQRGLGLRYETNRPSFGGFSGFPGMGGGDPGPEVWSFQVDGNVALGDVKAEVASEPNSDEVAWSMFLSEKTKTQDGVTLTFADVDNDGKVSAGDTLTIDLGDEGSGFVTLRDNVTGLRVTPGAGLVLGLLALAGVALLVRRR